MARQAEPVEPRAAGDARAWRFEGCCRPFHDRNILHRRRIELQHERLEVVDEISGATGRRVTSWLHLHPAFVASHEGGEWWLTGPGSRVRLHVRGAERVELVAGVSGPRAQGWYMPAFGAVMVSQVFELTTSEYDGRPLIATLDWTQ